MRTAPSRFLSLSVLRTAVLAGFSAWVFSTPSLAFDTPEHDALANQTVLTLANGERVAGQDAQLPLASGLSVSYGEVNAIPDFIGLPERFIDPADSEAEQRAAFMENFNAFYQGHDQYVANVRQVAQSTLRRNQQAMKNKQALSSSVLDDLAYNLATGGGLFSRGIYLKLAMSTANANHFAENALAAYAVGHRIALEMAAQAGELQDAVLKAQQLKQAYLINGYASHYLEDVFAAGHFRVPRLAITNTCRTQLAHATSAHIPHSALLQAYTLGSTQPAIIADAISLLLIKTMHDEDGQHGLRVRNRSGEVYDAYGDDLMFVQQNSRNIDYLAQAVQNAADEVHLAYATQRAQLPDTVTPLTPDLTSLNDFANPIARFKMLSDGSGGVQYYQGGGYRELNCVAAFVDLVASKLGAPGR